MNLVEIMGIVGSDPEERTTPSGSKVTTFRIADNIRKGSNGEETIWWRVTIWGDQYDRMIPYIKKGSALVVHGEIRRKPEIYQDREGNSQVAMEVTATQLRFSPFGRSQSSDSEGQPAQQRSNVGANAGANAPGSFSQSAQNAPSSSPGGSYTQSSPSYQSAPSAMSSPGGFRPAVGTSAAAGMDDFSEDNLPF